MRGADRVVSLVSFGSELQRRVAMSAFGRIYEEDTRRLLKEIGEQSAEDPTALVAFLHGPFVARDLFAPADTNEAVRQAVVLAAFGLPDAAVNALTLATQSGADGVQVRMSLGDIMAEMARPTDALKHYRKALEYDPTSVAVLSKVAALQLSLGRFRSAAESLESILKHDPGNVVVMSLLAEAYAGPLERRDRCAELVRRILELEPGHSGARELLAICGG
jgi:tetratricopeptide (TPR) repeat protein